MCGMAMFGVMTNKRGGTDFCQFRGILFFKIDLQKVKAGSGQKKAIEFRKNKNYKGQPHSR